MVNLSGWSIFGAIVLGVFGCAKTEESAPQAARLAPPCNTTAPAKMPAFAPPPAARANKLVVATSDFTAGKLFQVDVPSVSRDRAELPIHSDAIVRVFRDVAERFVINRLGADNLLVVSSDLARPVRQFSLGRGTNPQDIAVQGDRGWVSRYDSASILKVDWQRGQALCEIDASAYADADGLPELASANRFGDQIWIAVQRLDRANRYSVRTGMKSRYLVIDAASDAIVAVPELSFQNPLAEIRYFDGRLYSAQAGALADGKVLDGAIESWDPNELTVVSGKAAPLKTLKTVVTEGAVKADILDFDILEMTTGIALTSAGGTTRVVPFDPATGAVGTPIAESKGHVFSRLVKLGADRFALADGTPKQPRVRLFERAGRAAPWTERNVDAPMPPQSIAVE